MCINITMKIALIFIVNFSFFLFLYTHTHYNKRLFVCLNFAISCLIVMITSAVYSLCVRVIFFSSCHFTKFCPIHSCCYCCRRFICFVVLCLLVYFFSSLLFSVSFVKRRYVFFHSLLSWATKNYMVIL